VKKIIRAGLVLAVAGAFAAAGMAPAQAATTPPTLPEGSVMYAIDCQDTAGQLWIVDPVTGAATPVGTPVATANEANCAGQGTYDAVSGTAYYVGWGNNNVLTSVDLTTGLSTDVMVLDHNNCTVTAGNDGTLYELDSQNGPLYVIDPSNSAETPIGEGFGVGVTVQTCAVANNPVDDEIYIFRNNFGTYEYGTIDKTTGLWEYVGDVDISALTHAFKPDSMAIDSNGIAWIQDDGALESGFTAVDLSTGEAWEMAIGQFDAGHTIYPTAQEIIDNQNAEGYFYQMSIWIVPAEVPAEGPTTEPAALASTGVNGSQAGLISGVAALALIAGLGLTVARRRTARS
jgi:hypothetical protein